MALHSKKSMKRKKPNRRMLANRQPASQLPWLRFLEGWIRRQRPSSAAVDDQSKSVRVRGKWASLEVVNKPCISQISRSITTVILMSLAHVCSAQHVELIAKIEIIRWNREGVSLTEPWEVRCVVGTNTWLMEAPFLEGAKSMCLFEGTNLVQNHELSEPVGENQSLLDYTGRQDRFVQVATPSGTTTGQADSQNECPLARRKTVNRSEVRRAFWPGF
jgi:hypothetical protein